MRDLNSVQTWEQLVQKNDFFQTWIQPNIESKIEFDPTTNRWQEVRQRSCFTGYFHGKYLSDMISFLDQHKGSHIYRIWSLERHTKIKKRWRCLKRVRIVENEMRLKLFQTSCVSHFIVRVDRSSESLEQLSTSPWKYRAQLNDTLYPPPFDFNEYDGIISVMEEVSAFYLEIACMTYGFNEPIEDLLKKFFNQN